MTVLRAALSREAVEIEKRPSFKLPFRSLIWARQGGVCAECQEQLVIADMQIDHILPLELGGPNDDTNLQALCIPCHKIKTREDRKRIAKAARLRRDADPETRRRSARPLRGRGFQKADELK